MKTIIAIGGGEIGRPGKKMETKTIDLETIKCTGKKNPKLLFVPTASMDSEGYCKDVENYFGEKLGCRVDYLLLLDNKISKKEIAEKIFGSDIVYVGGGNTMKMLEVWKNKNVDEILKKAWEKGIVISGLSAGAVCWFEFFSSDSIKFVEGKDDFELIELNGLNWINLTFCPHYDTEEKREGHLKEMMKDESGVAIALDNCVAIKIVDDEYRIIRSKPSANAYKVYWKKGKYFKEKLVVSKKMLTVAELLLK